MPEELNTQNQDLEQLAHEIRVRKQQLTSALDALRVSESRFRRLVDSNIIGVITVQLDGKILEANDAFLRMVGYSREELNYGRLDLNSITPPEHAERDREALRELAKTGRVTPFPKEYTRKDGSRIPVLVGGALLEGSPESVVAFVLDLTDQKRSESRVQVQYAVARVLAETGDIREAAPKILSAIGDALAWDYGELWTITPDSSQLECVDTWCAPGMETSALKGFTGKARLNKTEGLPGHVWVTAAPCWISDLRHQPTFRRSELAVKSGINSAFGFPIVLRNEVMGVFAFFTRQFRDCDAELLQLMNGIGHQIGQFLERKHGEAALRASEERFRSVVEAMPQMVWTARADGFLDFYNQRWYDYTGLNYEKTRGWGWQAVMHPDDLERTVDMWTDSVQTGNTYQIEYRLRRKDGVYRWHLGRAVPLHDSAGRIVKWFGTSTDIDDQKRAEEAKQELVALVRSSDDAIFGKTLDGIITSWNPGAERIYGYKAGEIIGRPVWTLVPEERAHEISEILFRLSRGERIEHFETVRLTREGRRIDVSLTVSAVRNEAGQVTGGAVIARDITELKRAETALRNSEKHATVGRLAATMAHEINNPLEAVSNVLYLLEARSLLDPESKEYVSIAAQEVERIAHIVKQTLGFYRESQTPVMLDVGKLVENVFSLYSRKIQEKRLQVDNRIASTPQIPAFPAEMRQVFSNLIVNAIEASRAGGKLVLRVYPSRDWAHPRRRGVRITIADNGCGISPENQRNLFEPFFTTKGEKGTGLGLWVSNGIVQKHGGFIDVRSSIREGRTGTCFSVFLPSHAEQTPEGTAGTIEAPRQQRLFINSDISE